MLSIFYLLIIVENKPKQNKQTEMNLRAVLILQLSTFGVPSAFSKHKTTLIRV